MSQRTDYDILIVGGGMVGLSLACALKARDPDWRVAVLEKHQSRSGIIPPSFDARSTALSWSSEQVLRAIGCWDQIAVEAAAISTIHVSDRGHAGLTQMTAAEAGITAMGYVVENRILGSVLQQAAQTLGVEVREGVEVTQAIPKRDGYQLQLADQKSVDCALLVIADGADSSTARQMGIRSSHKSYGQVAIIANIAMEHPHNGTAYERFAESGPMALLPLPDFDGQHRAALVWTHSEVEAERLLSAPKDEFLAELQRQFGYRQGKLLAVGERHSYPLALHTADEQIRQHLVVLGNASHSLHPVAGQGFNLSLRDVAALVEQLSSARAAGDAWAKLPVLERYLAAQTQDQRQTILFSDQLPKLFGMPNLPVQAGRNVGLIAMQLLTPLRRQFARFGMGMLAGAKNG